MQITAEELLMGLKIAIAVLVLIVLYHALFIAVDLRRILRRFDDLTEQVEDVLLKPISMIDRVLQWVVSFLEAKEEKHHKHHAHHKAS